MANESPSTMAVRLVRSPVLLSIVAVGVLLQVLPSSCAGFYVRHGVGGSIVSFRDNNNNTNNNGFGIPKTGDGGRLRHSELRRRRHLRFLLTDDATTLSNHEKKTQNASGKDETKRAPVAPAADPPPSKAPSGTNLRGPTESPAPKTTRSSAAAATSKNPALAPSEKPAAEPCPVAPTGSPVGVPVGEEDPPSATPAPNRQEEEDDEEQQQQLETSGGRFEWEIDWIHVAAVAASVVVAAIYLVRHRSIRAGSNRGFPGSNTALVTQPEQN